MQAIEIRPTARRLGVCAETRRGPDGHRTGSVDRSGKCNGPEVAPHVERLLGMLQLRATLLPLAPTRGPHANSCSLQRKNEMPIGWECAWNRFRIAGKRSARAFNAHFVFQMISSHLKLSWIAPISHFYTLVRVQCLPGDRE